MPNIDELFDKWSLIVHEGDAGEFWINKENFTQARAEIISLPVEAGVMQKIKKGGSGQPMKDFEKAFYFNWKTMFLEDEMKLFYRVKKWFGEWCEENIENFSA